MPLQFLGQTVRSTTAWRIALVLTVVLVLHACGLYEVATGLSTLKAEDATQATLAVSLIAPPAPAKAAPAPAPPRPRPKAARAPTPVAPPPQPAAVEPPAPAEPPPVEEPVEPPPPDALPPVAAESSLLPSVAGLPTKGRIVYRTTYTRMRGVGALTFVDWSVDVERGRYELWLRTVDPTGLLDLRSVGWVKPFGIAPERYLERIEIANRELRADFDWSTNMVAFTGRGAGAAAGFAEGIQDPLSLQFQLPLLAQAFPWRFTPGVEMTFFVARRNIEKYTFVVEGYEGVRIGSKELQALKIDRRRGPDSNRRVELWMVPEYQWLPVRLRFTDSNDEVWDSVLAALPGEEQPREPIVQEPVKP
jgi:hypothetical protein